MTSTPVNLLSLRSGQSSDRPLAATLQQGQLAVAYGAADPGVYFEDSTGAIRKVGPAHLGTTAPNSTALGATGNSAGELWADSSGAQYYLRVWTGAAWQKVGAGFADSATTATSATTANFSAGAAVASGLPVTGSLPGSATQGTMMYLAAAPSGLYVYVGSAWVQI